jgi:hypothetical protein
MGRINQSHDRRSNYDTIALMNIPALGKNKMNKIGVDMRPRYRILFLIVVAVTFFILLVMNSFTYLCSDDYNTFIMTKRSGNWIFNMIETIGRSYSIENTKDSFFNGIDGRIFIIGSRPVYSTLPFWFINILNSIVFCAIMYVLVYLATCMRTKQAKEIGAQDYREKILFWVISFLIIILWFPAFAGIFLWKTASSIYPYSILSVLIFLIPYFMLLRKGGSFLHQRKYKKVVLSLVFFLIGMYAFNSPLNIGYFIVAIIILIEKRNLINAFHIFGVIGAIIGFALFVLSPATDTRSAGSETVAKTLPDHSFLYTIVDSAGRIAQNLSIYFSIPFAILFALLFCYFLLRSNNQPPRKLKEKFPIETRIIFYLLIGSGIGLSALMPINFNTVVSTNIERILHPNFILIVLAILISIKNIIDVQPRIAKVFISFILIFLSYKTLLISPVIAYDFGQAYSYHKYGIEKINNAKRKGKDVVEINAPNFKFKEELKFQYVMKASFDMYAPQSVYKYYGMKKIIIRKRKTP